MTPRMRALALVPLLAVALAGCGGSTSYPGTAKSTGASSAASSAATATASAADCPPAQGTSQRVTHFDAAPPMCIDPSKTYTALFATDAGNFTVTLDPKAAPLTVNNFVFLARNHFYDGTTFHRVLIGFMAQGGDPEGTGRGGPGYTIPDEFPTEPYAIGSIAMANTGAPNSGGSQFFIVTGTAGVNLPAAYSAFGIVTEGMDTVRAIEADGAISDPTPPTVVHTVKSVTITES